jgi:hypothetical protein
MKNPNLKVWFLLLTGLSSMVGDGRLEVRSRALQALFGTLHDYGPHFAVDMWRLVFNGVLFPIFDDVRHAEDTPAAPQEATRKASASAKPRSSSSVSSDWLQTTCLAALSTLVELFARFHHTVAPLLGDLLALINNCIDQNREQLGQIGVQCWVLLIRAAGGKFGGEEWTIVLASLASVFERTLPTELQSADLRSLLLLSPHVQLNGDLPSDLRAAPVAASKTPSVTSDAAPDLTKV